MESTDFVTAPLPPELPPGFRFHPTDEELVIHYLKKKAATAPLPVSIIADVNIYKYDPWKLPEKALFGEKEWYFFSPRERKYPNGARPNRAALSGYWKATGTDKAVVTRGGAQKVGVKKTLVFYGGKPPKGIKTNWIMHEYRLPDNKAASKPDFSNKKASSRLDDWVLCRIYMKTAAAPKDQEKDEIKDMTNSMAGNLLPPIGQHTFLSNDPNPMMIKAWGMSQAMPQLDLCSLQIKRSLPSSYSSNCCGDENLASTKRLLSENCTGPTDETSVNFFSTMLNYQVSQQNPQQTVLGSAQDGVFGLNWYS